ncbi:glycoside hydrolase family 78 protein [Jiella sp. MQZ9-1]|uniref:alpha-L-rhamnosidase n=1 Tax=Jiella flava TaxID=2816857 RepID=A0A939FW61_9HYPH|nr:alpha-L-rhamnosidase [Jiella flava]MBO0663083.1 family 78 glycoside hydrolase catalytic domain [Jiella flava]MCD2471502.1 glycoside hydrolase family 78 protein [Jiella flava]
MRKISERLRAVRLRCEHLAEPAGLNRAAPRFDWSLEGVAERQSGWRLIVGQDRDAVAAGEGAFYDGGRREGDACAAHWDGPALPSDRVFWWSVVVYDDRGDPAPPASPARLFTGLPHEEFCAAWIARYFVLPAGREVPSEDSYDNRFQARPADYLRREITLAQAPLRATAYVTALGLYELRINGAKIGDAVMAPGWTDYHRRIEYQSFDVTDRLRAGANCIGAILGEGWYSGRVGHNQRRAGNHYGGRPAFLCQIHLEFADGSRRIVTSDGNWLTARGPILYSDFLVGEAYDARRERDGWDRPGYDTADWQPVEVFEPEPAAPRLEAARMQPAREVARLPMHEMHRIDDELIFDTGQNLAGYVRLTVEAAAGTRFVLRHAERLDVDGRLYTENLRYAVSEDIYVARGGGREMFCPRFTFHGFQFVGVRVEGQGELVSIKACAIQTDTPWTGVIETANPMLNRLIANIEWGQRSNFLSVPTDCPQRDERYGWSADAQIFWRTAGFNADIAAFLTKWMEDLIDGQSPQGAFPDVAPTKPLNPYRLTPQPGAPAWGDAPIILAWHHWLRYADRDLVERCWPHLCAWMDYIAAKNPDGLRLNRVHNNYGDWLNVDQKTDPGLVATAYWIHLADLMARLADVLGRDRARWTALGVRLRAAFEARYGPDDAGRLTSDTQTACLLALDFDLLRDDAARQAVAARLDALLGEAGRHLRTGFIGVRHLCPVVADYLSLERAVDLLLCESYPSWGFSIRQGATTMWERWDGWTPEKGFQSPAMNSFNHYSFGAVGEWIWSRIAGIDWSKERPGFSHVQMRPIFDRRIGRVAARYDAARGRIESRWRIEGDQVTWLISLPPSTTAEVTLPEGLDAIELDGRAANAAFPLGPGQHEVRGRLMTAG